MGATRPNEKSLIVTYLLWLFLGFFGGHHIYLGRDIHGFLHWCTFGGCFGLGWIRDLFCIRRYVAEVNNDNECVQRHIKVLKSNKTPPFSIVRFSAMLSFGFIFGSVMHYAVPEEAIFGYDLNFLKMLVPLASAVGIWLVGNIGKEQGTFWWPLAGAYISYPLSTYLQDESTWFSLMVVSSTMAFDSFAKEWRRKPREKRSLVHRFTILTMAGIFYLSLITSYLYFNATLTDSDGEKIAVHEAISHFFTSPWWVDVKQSFQDLYVFAQHHGWYEIWLQIIDLSDPHGEINAYKVLGVDASSSQSEITSKWRSLSREFHPDKIKDPEKKAEAQNKFMEIQQAYEILSKIKSRRKSKNKKFSS